MTTPATGRELTSACNGVTTLFNCPVFVGGSAYLKVYLLEGPNDPIGILLSEGADYAIAGDGRAGTAQITTTVAHPTGKFIRRRRVSSREQGADYVPNDGFPADTHEIQLDRLSLIDEEHDADIADVRDRALLVAPGETAPGLLPPRSDRAGKYMAYDADGDPVASAGTGADAGLRTDLAEDAGSVLVGSSTGITVEDRLALNEASISNLLFLLGPSTLANIFIAGVKGAWWDTTRPDLMFQDAAGTIAAASGQPVGKVINAYGAAQPLTETTATPARRPTLVDTADGVRKIDFDGVNDRLTNVAVDLGAATQATVVAVLAVEDVVNVGTIMEWGYFPAGLGDIGLTLNNTVGGAIGVNLRDAAGSFFFGNDISETANNRNLVMIWDVIPGPFAGLKLMVNGEDRALTPVVGGVAGGPSVNMLAASRQIDIGARADPASFGHFGMIAMGIIPRLLTDTEKQIISAYGARLGRTPIVPPLPYSITPDSFDFTTENTNLGTHIQTSPLATIDVQTAATVLRLHGFTDLANESAANSEIGIEVNGAADDNALFGPDGARSSVVTQPAGLKTLRLVNSLHSSPAGTPLGNYLTRIEANAPLARVPVVAKARRLLVLGDSIPNGGNASSAALYGWPARMRRTRNVDVTVDGYGFGGYQHFASDLAVAAATAARIAVANPTDVWIAFINDYYTSLQTAVNCGADVVRLLDAIHAACPAAHLWLQTLTPLASEIANGFGAGNTAPDYRNEIANAGAGRAYTTVVNGTTLITLAGLADGVHPTDAGHATMEANISAVLGL